jgi:hypothetical protein
MNEVDGLLLSRRYISPTALERMIEIAAGSDNPARRESTFEP